MEGRAKASIPSAVCLVQLEYARTRVAMHSISTSLYHNGSMLVSHVERFSSRLDAAWWCPACSQELYLLPVLEAAATFHLESTWSKGQAPELHHLPAAGGCRMSWNNSGKVSNMGSRQSAVLMAREVEAALSRKRIRTDATSGGMRRKQPDQTRATAADAEASADPVVLQSTAGLMRSMFTRSLFCAHTDRLVTTHEPRHQAQVGYQRRRCDCGSSAEESA